MILNKPEMIDTFLSKKDRLWILLNSKIQFLMLFNLSNSQKLCVCVSWYVCVCVMFVHVCAGSHVYVKARGWYLVSALFS